MVFKRGFQLGNKVGEDTHGDGGARNGALLKSGCPGEGWSFGHVRKGESSHFAIGIVDFVIDEEIEADGI